MNLNPVSLVSNALESACDAILPEKLEFVGDLVSLASDIECGNWLGCLDDLGDLLADLPQQLDQLLEAPGKGATGEGATCSSPLEPPPPPAYGDGGTPPVDDVPVGAAPADPAPPQEAVERSIPRRGTRAGGPARQIQGPVTRGLPPAANQRPTTGAEGPEASRAKKTTSPAASGTASNSTKVTGSADSFFGLSDQALTDAIREGKIPTSVTKDQTQMLRLQQRMEDISRMNQLMTTMLNTLHEMNKAIIYNLRV